MPGLSHMPIPGARVGGPLHPHHKASECGELCSQRKTEKGCCCTKRPERFAIASQPKSVISNFFISDCKSKDAYRRKFRKYQKLWWMKQNNNHPRYNYWRVHFVMCLLNLSSLFILTFFFIIWFKILQYLVGFYLAFSLIITQALSQVIINSLETYHIMVT